MAGLSILFDPLLPMQALHAHFVLPIDSVLFCRIKQPKECVVDRALEDYPLLNCIERAVDYEMEFEVSVRIWLGEEALDVQGIILRPYNRQAHYGHGGQIKGWKKR